MALQTSVADQWEKMTGKPVLQGYGLTETSPVLTFNPLGKVRPGRIGVAVSSTDIRCHDDHGQQVPHGEPGEIAVRGPQVMGGYWQKPDETDLVLQDGWFRTGDIGVTDADGYLTLVDRKKDMVIASGFNVYPNEVEGCLSSHPGVLEAAVIGVPDEGTGEAVKGFVVSKDKTLTEADLRAHCKVHLTPYKVPKTVMIRDDLPKSNVGKILRKTCARRSTRRGRQSRRDGWRLRTDASGSDDFFIMLGMGASLTPRDFYLALRRPYGLTIGVISQYGFMPFIGFLLVSLLTLPEAIAVGVLIMSCMPGGTTSDIFTYFSKGNLALPVLMTVTSTVAGVVLIPIILVLYASVLDLSISRESIIVTLVLLLVPVGIGMVLRKISANVGAVTEFFGSALALFFIVFLIVSWVPRNWQFLLETSASTFIAATGLGAFGIAIGYFFARALRLHPRSARAIALETGIPNGPLAFAIIVFTFSGSEAQSYMAVPVLYSLFIVIISTAVTMVFRRANTAAEQKIPDSLL